MEEDDDIEDIWQDVRSNVPRPKMYEGQRSSSEGTCTVYVFTDIDRWPLNKCFDTARMSENYEWGYSGCGPCQLALAILCEHFGHGERAHQRALRIYPQFEALCVAKLHHKHWLLEGGVVGDFVEEIESQIEGEPSKT